MLNTKLVRHLQSKPYHIRMSLFIFIMAFAIIAAFSFWLTSLKGVFLAATQKEKLSNEQSEIIQAKNNLPSLFKNMKANISEFSGTVSGLYSGYLSENKSKSGLDIETIRKIKPVDLPIDEQ